MDNNSPSYKGFKPASEASSKSKRANRRRDTKHEVLLRRALWHMGLRYRKHVKDLPGKPDIVFRGPRVAVFCDGDFWHGRNWPELRQKLARRKNSEYWIAKIRYNIERDRKNNQKLKEDGWHVVRVWETDIHRDPDAVAARIKSVIENVDI